MKAEVAEGEAEPHSLGLALASLDPLEGVAPIAQVAAGGQEHPHHVGQGAQRIVHLQLLDLGRQVAERGLDVSARQGRAGAGDRVEEPEQASRSGILPQPLLEALRLVDPPEGCEGDRLVPGDGARGGSRQGARRLLPSIRQRLELLELPDEDQRVRQEHASQPFSIRVPGFPEGGDRAAQRLDRMLVIAASPEQLSPEQQVVGICPDLIRHRREPARHRLRRGPDQPGAIRRHRREGALESAGLQPVLDGVGRLARGGEAVSGSLVQGGEISLGPELGQPLAQEAEDQRVI